MAEIFGIVAGGIGATSLAIQIIEKAYQLNTLLKSSKDIPSEVQDKLLEIELFANTLSDMEELYRNGPQTSTAKSAAKVIELCKNIATDLTSMVNELEACSTGKFRSYGWKSVKAVLRKDRIDRVTLRMQHAMSPLTMYTQIHTHISLSKDLKTILDQTTRLSLREAAPIIQQPSNRLALSPLKTNPAQKPLRQHGRVTWTSTNSYWVAIGYLIFSNGKSQLPQRLRHHAALTRARYEDDVWELQFRPASWFGHRVCIVSARKITSVNWKHTMISCNLRDQDAAIFIACRNGDIETVRQLLDDGLASPFDLTPDGATPLHFAAIVASSEICQLLIDCGADGNFVVLPGQPTPLMCLAQQAYKHDNEIGFDEPNDRVKLRLPGPLFGQTFLGPRATAREILDTVRVLVEKGQSDPMIGTTVAWDSPSVLYGWEGPSEPFLWLLRQDHFDVDIERRGEIWGQSIFHFKAVHKSGPRLILDALFQEKNYPTLTEARDNLGDSVLHQAVWAWCINVLELEGERSHDREVTESYTLVRRLLEIGSDVHAKNSYGYTPLDRIMKEIAFFLRGRKDTDDLRDVKLLWRSLVRSWFAALVNAGYSLREYAETEQSLRPNQILKPFYQDKYSIRIIFLYGEDPNDVDIDLEEVEEEDNESPDISDDESDLEVEEPLPMPGSWQ